jgi:uncharacterized protein
MIARLRRAIAERHAAWESLCLRCGLCCHEKVVHGAFVATNYGLPCPHLDTSTHACTVYERRFETCPDCRKMTLRHALFVRWLPESCAYVQRYRVHGMKRRTREG